MGMSAAERQARQRQRRKAEIQGLRDELAQAHEQIAALTVEIERLKTAKPTKSMEHPCREDTPLMSARRQRVLRGELVEMRLGARSFFIAQAMMEEAYRIRDRHQFGALTEADTFEALERIATACSKGPRHRVVPTTDAEAFGRALTGGEGAKRRRGGLQKLTPARVREAIWKRAGVIAHAARALGVTRQALYKYLRAHPDLAEALHEARETFLDIAEGNILRGIRAGDLKLSQLYLMTKGKSRGWTYSVKETSNGSVSPRPLQV